MFHHSSGWAEKHLPTPIYIIFAITFLIMVIGINYVTSAFVNAVLGKVEVVKQEYNLPED